MKRRKYFSHFIFCFALFFFFGFLLLFSLFFGVTKKVGEQEESSIFRLQLQIKTAKRFTKLTKRKVFQFYQHFFPLVLTFLWSSFVWISRILFLTLLFEAAAQRFRTNKQSGGAWPFSKSQSYVT